MSAVKHTPTPWSWKIEPQHYPECDDADLPAVIRGSDGKEVVTLYERYGKGVDPAYEQDADFIVRACNAHDDLVEALKDTLRMLEAVRLSAGLGKKQMERVEKAKAVLAKASAK